MQYEGKIGRSFFFEHNEDVFVFKGGEITKVETNLVSLDDAEIFNHNLLIVGVTDDAISIARIDASAMLIPVIAVYVAPNDEPLDIEVFTNYAWIHLDNFDSLIIMADWDVLF